MNQLGDILSTDLIAEQSDINNLQTQINGIVPSNQLITGGVIYAGTGFNYNVSACTYRILGVLYASAPAPVVLSASDPTNDRIDVIYVDDTGSVGVLTGTPAPSPVKPNVNSTSQVEVTFITVGAGTTTPPITLELIYNENTGTPTEWNGTSNDVNVNFASTNDPYNGTVSIETNSPLGNNKNITFTPSAPYAIVGGNLTFWMKAKQDMSASSGVVYIGFFDVSGLLVGSAVFIGGTTSILFGFDPTNTTDYQGVTIPITAFGVLPANVDELRFFKTTGGTTASFFLDLIQIQEGVATPPSTTAGHEIQDEGVSLPQQPVLDFQGAGVAVTDDPSNDKTVVTIAGGGAGAWQPPEINLGSLLTSGATFIINTGSAGVYLSFSGVADDTVFFNTSLDNHGNAYDGSNIKIRLHWRIQTNGGVGDTVGWVLQYALYKANDITSAGSTTVAQQDVDVSTWLADQLKSTDLATMTGVATADVLMITLTRNSSGAGADSYAGNAELLGIEIIKV